MTFENQTFSASSSICRELGLERLTMHVVGSNPVPFFRASVHVHCYHFHVLAAPSEHFMADPDDHSKTSVFSKLFLPSRSLDGLWHSLVMPVSIKETLLAYASSSLLFSDLGVNQNFISTNRMLLLHGPPGTGKTSLSKALAQQLAIRYASRYAKTTLVEVNAQAIFSKWFSESARTVGKLFELIFDLASEPSALVLVLIDEVESLVASRTRASSADPSDALRVVNSILTQLDRLKSCSNVLLMCTSNVTDVIDNAFLDRADFKLLVGPPDSSACLDMLRQALEELARVGLVSGDVASLVHANSASGQALRRAADLCANTSGRFVRKLPMKVHAQVLGAPSQSVGLDVFVQGLLQVLEGAS